MLTTKRNRRVTRSSASKNLRPAIEPLEGRILLTVEPLTLAAEERFGLDATGISQFASVSRDGQVIAFQSSARDLVSHDANALDDVFVYFRATGQLQLVSVNAAGTGAGNSPARNPRVSPDGRYVMFESASTDLIAGAGGFGASQLFARDLQTDTTVLVSAGTAGGGGNRQSENGFWSADGTKVVFQSLASNLGPVDTNNLIDIYLRDLAAGTTIRVSEAQDGTEATTRSQFFGNLSSNPRISGNGRFVVFNSFADNLGPVDGTTQSDIYLKDLQTGAVELISIDTAGVNQPNGNPLPLSRQTISDDGRYVIFGSGASNLVPGPFNNSDKVFIRDRVNKTLNVVSILPNGNVAEGFAGVMTPDGRHVAFVSAAVLDPTVSDQNGDRDVFVRDLVSGTTRLVSIDQTGTKSGNARSGFGYYPNVFTAAEPQITDDGRYIAFPSYSSNLTNQPDTNSQLDVFRRDMQLGTTTAVSDGRSGLSHTSATSADLRTFVFENAIDPGVVANRSIVWADLETGQKTVASIRSPQLPAEWLVGGGIMSTTSDGRYVAFHAGQTTDYAPDITFRGFQTASSYVRDRRTGEITVVDLLPDGKTAAGGYNPIITPDGRFVAFTSRQPTGGSPPLVDGVTFAGPAGGFFSADVYLRDLATGVTRIVSVDPTGKISDNGRGGGGEVAVSDDGRYVAFTAAGTNLVNGLTNAAGHVAIYQRDMWTNTTALVSHNLANDGMISGPSTGLNMSRDGRYVSFVSRATDLVAGDSNNVADVFRWDRQSGALTLVSRKATDNTPGTGPSGNDTGFLNRMTPDGRHIVFVSGAADLVAGDSNNQPDVFVRDMTTEQTTLVSVTPAGNASGNGKSYWPSITPDGKKVAFISSARNLTNVATTGEHAFVRDLTTGITEQISVTPSGAAANDRVSVTANAFDSPTFSRNGRYVAFRSLATNLVNGFVDANLGNGDVFIRDLQSDRTMLVTYNESGTAGALGANASSRFLFTDDETTLFLDSDARNLFPGDRNDAFDVYAFQIAGHARILGTVFNDLDQDGMKNANEPGLVALPVYLDANGNHRLDRGEMRLQSDASGNYAFTNLPTGSYEVRVELPDGLTATTPPSRIVSLAMDDTIVNNQDFGGFAAPVDLKVLSIVAPAQVSAGRALEISWTVANVATNPVAGDWQDAVYLSADRLLDAADILLGTVAHTGGLGAQRNYLRHATFSAPATRTGEYFVFVQSDRRSQIDLDTNRENNLAAAADSLTVAIPEITLNTPASDSFTAANQDRYFQVTVEAGQSVELELNSSAASGGTELYTRFNRLPNPYEFDVASREFNQTDQRVTIPLTRPGTYYVLARSRFGAAASSSFTITAKAAVFQIDAVSPATGGNTGRVTIEIRGKQLTASTVPTLIRGGTTIPAASVDFRDASLLYATFELSGQSVGNYDVRLVDGAKSSTLAGAFSIVAGTSQTDPLRLSLSPPEFVRAGRQGKLLVEYENMGNTNVTAPLLRLTASNAVLRFSGQATIDGNEITFLGIAPDGPAGVLRPGQHGRVELEFLSNGPVGQAIDFQLFRIDPAEIIDWAAIKGAMRPSYIPVDAWDAVFANLLDEVGTTAGQYESVLARDATHLSSLSIYTPDVGRLLALELGSADAALADSSLATVVDSSQPAPGFDLTFIRRHMQTIHGRYTQGPFGRGWSHEWDIEAITQANGDVIIRYGEVTQFFFKQADGSYDSPFEETGTLTLAGAAFTLSATDGVITKFRDDGNLDFIEDVNGNRVTASYDANNRLSSLAHGSGATITFTYNAQGHIARVSDSAGRTITYSYDTSGEHLIGYADQYGSHTYTYLTGQGAAREHALESIKLSNDIQRFFMYDARGRLTSESHNGGEQRLNYTYLTGAALTITNLVGGATTLQFNDHGQLARQIDPLGRVADLRYDANRNLTNVILPGAVEYQYVYDGQGNLTTATDAIGQTTSFTYDAHSNLTSFTDALMRTTRYHYDEESNLERVEYSIGTDEEFVYDAFGNATSATNRRGRTVGYQYNAAGQVIKRNLPDGRVVDYTYDARGRLQSATDDTGTIMLQYSPLDALIKITYSNGRFLQFDYNTVGQRTRSVDHDGFIVNYVYDDLGRLDRLTDGSGGLIVDYTYDASGRLVRKDNGNGTISTFDFDSAGQLIRITHVAPGGALNSKLDYTYDSLGRRISVMLSDNDPTTTDGKTNYGYDPLGQLASVQLPGGRTIQYEYDAVGNRIAVRDNGVSTNYKTISSGAYTQVGDTAYTYDADGNLIAKVSPAGATTYTFDDDNRLRGVSGPGLNAAYTYDPLGHRSSATINGQVTEFLVDPDTVWRIASEYDDAGNLMAHYTWGLTLTSRVDSGAAPAFYDFDAAANTLAITNASGAYVNRYSYLPFGETTTHAAEVSNPFTFVGAFGVRTEAGGLSDMRYRNYEAATGQFVSTDPLLLAAGDVNFRRYAKNRPLDRIDPAGLADFPTGPQSGGVTGGGIHLPSGILGPNGQPIPPNSQQPSQPSAPSSPQLPAPVKQGPLGKCISATKMGFGSIGTAATVTQAIIWLGNQGYLDWLYGPLGGFYYDSCPKFELPPNLRPPPIPSVPKGDGKTKVVGSSDPNDILGPAGAGPDRHVLPEQTLPYTIRFENQKAAGAPAQEVFVTHPLDDDLDLATFELGDAGFASVVVDVPSGLQTYATRVDYQNQDGSPLTVDISVELDVTTRMVVWTFRSIDPASGLLPEGVFDGFLPPNTPSPIGEGFVTYSIRPKSDLSSGTRIEPVASIVFDVNEPIVTPPIFHTIDAGTPTSQVGSLPATSPGQFTVSWTGTDEAGGSGIGTYDVFVSDNGGPFVPLIVGTPDTSAPFNGQAGHTYRFHSVATDLVGHRETAPIDADAQTQVVAPPADFNDDGRVNAIDIDLLCAAIHNGGGNAEFDLDSSGSLNQDDATFLVKNVLRTSFGDANVDGIFNSADLVQIFQAGQYEDGIVGNSGWIQGDWNCDGDFTSGDLVVAFQDGGYVSAALTLRAGNVNARDIAVRSNATKAASRK